MKLKIIAEKIELMCRSCRSGGGCAVGDLETFINEHPKTMLPRNLWRTAFHFLEEHSRHKHAQLVKGLIPQNAVNDESQPLKPCPLIMSLNKP